MAEERLQRRLAAIPAADVAGYTWSCPTTRMSGLAVSTAAFCPCRCSRGPWTLTKVRWDPPTGRLRAPGDDGTLSAKGGPRVRRTSCAINAFSWSA